MLTSIRFQRKKKNAKIKKHMSLKNSNFIHSIKECRYYGLELWQCPQFLFPVMGAIIIASIISTYFIAPYYIEEPGITALIVLAVTAVLFVIGHIIISSFETVASSSRAKSEFVSIMSHQLRTPLSVIRWQLDLLTEKNKTGDKEIQQFFSHLAEENQRMIHIINDLLELNRIEDNTLILNPVSFSLKEIAENLVQRRNKSLAASNSNLSIETQFPQNLPDVFADKTRTEAVISHIVDNAIRYSSDNGKIIISLEALSAGWQGLPKYVRCSVKDRGIGISKEDQKMIFRKFFRAENVYKYQTQGLGIRLYLARAIVELSAGKIGFISEEGTGSKFWFTLPVAKKV